MQDSEMTTFDRFAGKHALAGVMLIAAVAVLAGLFALAAPAGAQKAYAAQGLEAGSAMLDVAVPDALSTSLTAQESGRIYEDPSDSSQYIYVIGKDSGSAKFNASTRTLTLSNVKCTDGSLDIYLSGKPITVNLVGTNTIQSIYSDVSVIVKGSGSLTGGITCSSSKYARLRVAGGTIKGNVSSGGAFTMTGGKIAGNVNAYYGNAKMTGGAIKGTLGVDGKFTMTGGTISLSNAKDSAVNCNGLAMTGGFILTKNTNGCVSVHGKQGKPGNLVISGGKIEATAPTYTGVTVSGGNLLQKGGTLAVVGAKRDAFFVWSQTYNNKKYGGKATIKGGAFKATVTDPSIYYALNAESIANKITAVKDLTGRVGKGMQFKRGGNVYKTMSSYAAKLVKYGSSKKGAVVNKVTYGKHSFDVQGIAAGAFNTAAGHKVTSIVVASYLTELGAKAFANTKSLKALRFNSTGWMKRNYDSSYNLKSVTVNSGYTISAKAFYKCGKGGGKYLKIALGKSGVWSKQARPYKRFLIGRGLSSKAKLKTY